MFMGETKCGENTVRKKCGENIVRKTPVDKQGEARSGTLKNSACGLGDASVEQKTETGHGGDQAAGEGHTRLWVRRRKDGGNGAEEMENRLWACKSGWEGGENNQE